MDAWEGSAPGDHELVARVKKGDMEAFDLLMLRHQDMISGWLRRFTVAGDMVEDLTQTVFVKAYMGLSRYRPERPFPHWLRAIAYRVGCDHWHEEHRKGRQVPLHACAEWLAGGEEGAPSSESVVLLELERLKPHERQTLSMLYLEDRSIAEVARAMGWNHDATKMRAYRARNKLRRRLERKLGPMRENS